ncbi:MAG TPA: hypothetical protein VK427_13185 [Kofleriaceae bacterium]|nr:hypothetical protein [Kofleriaceae bacterium]
MKPDVALELLHHVADLLKVRVSYESLASSVGNGGLCKVKGEYRIIVDKRASSEERVIMLATALASFDTAALGLAPKTRSLLRQYENSSKTKRSAA